jgi:hypothetical protein
LFKEQGVLARVYVDVIGMGKYDNGAQRPITNCVIGLFSFHVLNNTSLDI